MCSSYSFFSSFFLTQFLLALCHLIKIKIFYLYIDSDIWRAEEYESKYSAQTFGQILILILTLLLGGLSSVLDIILFQTSLASRLASLRISTKALRDYFKRPLSVGVIFQFSGGNSLKSSMD